MIAEIRFRNMERRIGELETTILVIRTMVEQNNQSLQDLLEAVEEKGKANGSPI